MPQTSPRQRAQSKMVFALALSAILFFASTTSFFLASLEASDRNGHDEALTSRLLRRFNQTRRQPGAHPMDPFYVQNASFSRSLPCICEWAENTERIYRHEWMFPCDDHRTTNWTYLQVMKGGSTTCFQQCGFSKLDLAVERYGPLRAEGLYLTSDIFTFVRDPIEHFLSGYKECKTRGEPTTFPFPKKQSSDDDLLLWLRTLGHHDHPKRVKNPLRVFWCFLHSAPQIELLLFHDDDGVLENRPDVLSTDILPHIKYVGDMGNIREFFNRSGLPWRDSKVEMRHRASKKIEDDIRARLQNSTIVEICQFVAIDYCFFDYTPPEVCRDYVEQFCDSTCPAVRQTLLPFGTAQS